MSSAIVNLLKVRVSRKSRGIPLWLLLFISIPAGLDPFLQPRIYESPAFKPITRLVHIQTYAIGWLLISAVTILFLFSRRYVWYILANLAGSFMAIYIHLILLYAKFVVGFPITLSSLGTWTAVGAACVYNLLTPIVVYRENDVLSTFIDHTSDAGVLEDEISQEHQIIRETDS